MPKLKSIYKMVDGAYIEDRAVAKRHEAWLELIALCDHYLDATGLESGATADMGVGMADYLRAHSKEVQRLLRAKPRHHEDKSGEAG